MHYYVEIKLQYEMSASGTKLTINFFRLSSDAYRLLRLEP